jgi:hypothetical protein
MSITSFAPRTMDWGPGGTPDTVGPGAYDVQSVVETRYGRKVPFGSTTRRELFRAPEYEVGPGVYDTSTGVITQPGHNFGMESDRRYFEDLHGSPSPAAYTVEASKPFMQRRSAPTTRSSMVGVREVVDALYLPRQQQKVYVPAIGASRVAQRSPVVDNGVPGPGKYSQTEGWAGRAVTSVFRSEAKRSVFQDVAFDATVLGPQPWKIASEGGGGFGSRAPRQSLEPNHESLGPSLYQAPVAKVKVAPIPRAGRSMLGPVDPQSLIVPGAGTYDMVKPRTGAVRAPRLDGSGRHGGAWGPSEETPGPAYDCRSSLLRTRSAGHPAPPPAPVRDEGAGPAYDTHVGLSKRGPAILGKAGRFDQGAEAATLSQIHTSRWLWCG